MSDVSVRPLAERDLAKIVEEYEQQWPGLGDQFLDEFLAAARRIGEHPLLYQVVHRDVRRVLIRRFPYLVFYRVTERGPVIVGVFHAHRAPATWQSRR